MKALLPMRKALADPHLFGKVLAGESWRAWRIILIAAMGEALTDEERTIFQALTNRPAEPVERVNELWAIIGRRGGKTRAIAVLAAYIAALVDWRDILAPGERASVLIMSATIWQARKAKQYLEGIFSGVPAFKKLVKQITADTVELTNFIDLECRPASFRNIRGGTAVAVIADEAAFWFNADDNSSNPDSEILNACRPALATTGGMLAVISSPYARRGEVWNAHRNYYGKESDVLVIRAPSKTMNPTLAQSVIDRAYERDPASAAAEFGGEFRTDVESFISREAVEACVSPGILERPFLSSNHYAAFVDPSGGSSDSFTLAIGHREREGLIVVDAISEHRPPFSPESVVGECAALLKAYRVSTVHGDRYGGEFPREIFRKFGIDYRVAEKNRSELYLAMLPKINSRQIDLLDHARCITQLVNLERRTARSGKDSIDHAPGSHDDVANSVAGVVETLGARPALIISDEMLAASRRPGRYFDRPAFVSIDGAKVQGARRF